jgi:hypothetical protein
VTTNSTKSAAAGPANSKSDKEALPPTVLEPLKRLGVNLTRVTKEIAKVEDGQIANLRAAIGRFRETLMPATEGTIRKEMDAQLQTALAVLREEFDLRLRDSTAEYQQENEKLIKELDELKRSQASDQSKEEVQAEIDRTAKILTEISEEMARMLEDPDVELAKIITENSAQNELRAYMRGLLYQINRDRAGK